MEDYRSLHQGLTFTEAVVKCIKNRFNFKGRASRSEYWWFFLFVTLVNSIIEALLKQIFIAYPNVPNSAIFFSVISLSIFLFFLITQFAVATRRLHDSGKSGWFQLIGLIPLLGTLVLIILLCQRSDPYENKYGVLEY